MSDDFDRILRRWDFEAPESQIARYPTVERSASRLWWVDEGARAFAEVVMGPLPGDVVVLNDVWVLRARLRAHRQSGGAVEVLVTRPEGAGFRALLRPGRKLRVGEVLSCGSGQVVLEHRHEDGSWRVRAVPDVDTLAADAGEVPLPPYLGRAAETDDAVRYQTVYAERGALRASAAPTAGLHLTEAILAAWTARGVHVVRVALEVGLGTFAPLTAEAWHSGRLHAERYVVPEVSFAAVEAARAEGRRVIAVGTTSLRVLESMEGPGWGETTLFIREGYRFRRTDVLLTNFHLPRSSLLMLVTTFGGHERVMGAYSQAIAEGFRLFSFGDAMWVTRG